jgi:hypothetical protein
MPNVAYWHLSDMTPQSSDVCYRGMNGPSSHAVQGLKMTLNRPWLRRR